MELGFQILDCTLRDGGYYTDWDFDHETVEAYVTAMNKLPVSYLEIGYRNHPSSSYLGKFGYTPIPVAKAIRELSDKKIAVMLNQKSVVPADLDELVLPLKGLVDKIRLAVDPKNFDSAVELARCIKEMGFEVAFNLMYMSKWEEYDGLIDRFHHLDGVVDVFNMVDSYGGILPEEVREITTKVMGEVSCMVGFHGHNNLQMALANSLAAIGSGVRSVDATVLGMGRGAGNLNLELLLTYLSKKRGLSVDFNELGAVISAFSGLMDKYRWGTSLPYMISGSYSFPQKEVMAWVSNRLYSFNSIVRALNNRIDRKKDNAKYPELEVSRRYRQALVIGGGSSVVEHIDALRYFLSIHPETALILATARHAAWFQDIRQDIFYCMAGSEGKRLSRNVKAEGFHGTCVLPPYPRTMGTEIPEFAQEHTCELKEINVVDEYRDSVTSIALQLAEELVDGEVFLAGYDGYPGNVLSEKEVTLTHENDAIFSGYQQKTGRKLRSLTPTIYRTLAVESIYQKI